MNPRHYPRWKPPWWPEGEPWPPQGPPGRKYWRGVRGRFFRRIGCGFLLLLLLTFGAFTLLFWLIISTSGLVQFSPSVLASMRLVGILVILLGLVVVFLGGLALRRAALPIGDLLEAAGDISAGDYTTRVEERGPGEVRALAHAINTMAARLQVDDEQRRNLLAEVTHELRTPLTVIQGNLEGLLDGIYPPDQEHIRAILEETQVLTRLIEDLRTLSLAESGVLKLQLEVTDLEDLVDEVVTSFQAQAKAAGLSLQVNFQPDLPPVEVDPTRLREVLVNLFANALRYTPPGGQVEIRAWAVGDPRQLSLSVKDSGPGIDPQDLPHIFDRFYKTDDSQGSGLGLAIARSLIAAHGGEIDAQSVLGQGTTIHFSLPLS
jgi:signal transduction histidine kinase